jgi:hypothetical protein
MLEELLSQAEPWHWFAAALIFMMIELAMPGFIMIWFGVAAASVGLILLMMPLSAQVQLAIWAALSIASIIVWRIWRKKNPAENPDLSLNRRQDAYIGRSFSLSEASDNGYGKVKVDDSIWKVRLEEDLKKGTKVRITGTDGAILIGEKAE